MHRVLTISLGLLAMIGCSPNPDVKPDVSQLAGTWIPISHTTRPPTQFLILTTNYTFVASNFPVSPNFGQTAFVSGSGAWELKKSYSAFDVEFRVDNTPYEFRVVGALRPFTLAASIYDDDEKLKARRLEDTKK